jgi:hypothetical protein
MESAVLDLLHFYGALHGIFGILRHFWDGV